MRFALLLLLVSCIPIKPDPPIQPYSCASMCKNGEELGCVWAAPTPLGEPCEKVCTNAADLMSWDLKCRSTATSCYDVDRCER